jgi:hypothetical protein
MKKTLLAFAVVALALAAVPASQAAPIAPIASGVANDHSGVVTKVWWRRGWHHRHCWRGAYGRWHCRYW